MNREAVTTRRKASLKTPTGLGEGATKDISGALNALLADVFALYMKTKNFHWHMSGPHFRDYHLLLDEQADQIYAITDTIAERVRKLGGTTLRSIKHVSALQRIDDNDADYVTPLDMLAELRDDTRSATSTATSRPRACSRCGSTRPRSASGSCSRPAAAGRKIDRGEAVAKPAKDASVFAHIEALVAEEHRLFEHGEPSDEQKKRLGEVQIELDRYWDLLRQRRALREYGRDPSEAHERDPDTVKKYIG